MREIVTLEAEELAVDWAVAPVVEAAAALLVATGVANQGAALVAEAAMVSVAAAAAANQAVATELAEALVAGAVTESVEAMALAGVGQEAVLVAAAALESEAMAGRAAARDLKQRQSGPLPAQVASRFLQRRVLELKARLLRSFPLLKSSGDAPVRIQRMLVHAHGLFPEHQRLPLPLARLRSKA